MLSLIVIVQENVLKLSRKLGSGSKLCLDLEARSLMKQSLDTLDEQDERCDMQTGTNQAMLTSGLTAGQIRQLFRRCPPLWHPWHSTGSADPAWHVPADLVPWWAPGSPPSHPAHGRSVDVKIRVCVQFFFFTSCLQYLVVWTLSLVCFVIRALRDFWFGFWSTTCLKQKWKHWIWPKYEVYHWLLQV